MSTLIAFVPAAARSEAEMSAVSRPSSTNVVRRLVPFHCTVESDWNPLPITAKVSADIPVVALVGLIVVTTGVVASAAGAFLVARAGRHSLDPRFGVGDPHVTPAPEDIVGRRGEIVGELEGP